MPLKSCIPCLGIEPSSTIARAAERIGVPTEKIFLERATADALAANYGRADPVIANSADNLDFVSVEQIEDSLAAVEATLDILEQDAHYLLGKRGLYSDISGHPDRRRQEASLLWTLNYCDGRHSILEIAEKSGRSFAELLATASKLEVAGLLEKLV